MTQSKITTWLGLALGAIGVALAFLGQHNVGGAVLVGIGLALSGLGRSLLGSACILCALLPVMVACNGSLPPNVVQGGVATIETAICVMNTFSKDKAAGKSDGDAIGDCIVQCGTDAATITRVLDAHHAAEMREEVAK